MSTKKLKIGSKYILQNIFDFIPLNKTIKIIKYNQSFMRDLDYSKNIIKYFFLLKKIIKPISNCEDYLPIIRRILSSGTLNINIPNNNQILILFCTYFNKNNLFIPQISNINGNEDILNRLNAFKIGFNNQLINSFIDKEEINFTKLFDFCGKYGKKIKEITFMDNNYPIEPNSFDIMSYIIENSNIQKIEDSSYNTDSSLFTSLINLNYINKDKDKNLEAIRKKHSENYLNNILKSLKCYSLYLKEQNSIIYKSVNDIVLLNALNIEELDITNIDTDNSSHFINLLKNFHELKSLSISCQIENEYFYNDISDVIKENSLQKLKMNLKYFKYGIKIISNNLKSLKELTLEIKYSKGSKQLIKLISELTNLQKLKIIAKFQVINMQNIKLLNLPKVEYLQIPLYIRKYFFDLNSFFGKIPKLKKLIFYNINFIDFKDNPELKRKNIEYLEQINLDGKLVENLRTIKFINSKQKCSFFILKLLNAFSKKAMKDNIKKIKIKNCRFDNETKINDLFLNISSFKNIKSLKLDNISFEQGQEFNSNSLEGLEKLEKFNFKGIDYEKNRIDINKLYSFLLNLSLRNNNINEVGISTKTLNGKDVNIIIDLLRRFKLLTKISIFDNYSKIDYFSNSKGNENLEDLYINLMKIKYYCMIDLRNIDVNTDYYYPKISINNNFNLDKKKESNNKKEKYFIFHNLFNDNYSLKYLCYSNHDDSFKVISNNLSNTNEKQ